MNGPRTSLVAAGASDVPGGTGDFLGAPTHFSGHPPETNRRLLAEAGFTLLRDEVVRAGFDRLLNAGVVLTGGGALLPGVLEIAEQVFDLPVRVARSNGLSGIPDSQGGPRYTTSLGLSLYAARHRSARPRASLPIGAGSFHTLTTSVRRWFQGMFLPSH